MRIAILGYGKMGKEIEQICLQRKHEVSHKIDSKNTHQISDLAQKTDVAIEFSTPENTISNIEQCIKQQIPVIVGTTGWYDQIPKIKSFCKEHGGSALYASNFSIGVNIFFEINRQLAKIMNGFPEYEVEVNETHHIHKLDQPSGTAITIAHDMIGLLSQKSSWVLNNDHEKDKLNIISHREGEVIGDHSVTYSSNIDHITIKHSAHNRKGFALGSVLAAEWLWNKTGFYTINDMLNFKR